MKLELDIPRRSESVNILRGNQGSIIIWNHEEYFEEDQWRSRKANQHAEWRCSTDLGPLQDTIPAHGVS